ncbi:MAG: hypothetical protein C0483_11220 [Pirellula sp.]|nr:hypothetical protein [Pirellula sp.]
MTSILPKGMMRLSSNLLAVQANAAYGDYEGPLVGATMLATSEAAKSCPRFQTPLDPRRLRRWASHRLHPLRRRGATEAGDRRKRRPQTVPVEDGGLLVDLQELLLRMLVGIFQFIFIKLPSEIVHALVRWFPTLIRLGNVIVLFVLWVGAALGPLAFSRCHEGRESPWITTPLPVPEFICATRRCSITL